MNFAEHRIQVEAVLDYSDKRRQGLAQLQAAFKERVSMEFDSAKRFERLAAISFSAFSTPSLGTLLGTLRLLWQSEATQCRLLAESLEKELIQPLAFLISLQTDEYKTELKQAKSRFKHVKELISHNEKTKGKYYKACKETEALINTLENSRVTEENRRKLLGKIEAGRKEIVASELEYEQSVNELTFYEPDYSTYQAITMATLAKQEHARNDRLQSDFRKLVAFEMTKVRKILNEKEQIESVIDGFDRDAETLLYVKNSSEQVSSLRTAVYSPYSGDHPLFRKGTLRMMRLGEDWMDLVRTQRNLREVNPELEGMVARAWHGDGCEETDFMTVRVI